MAKFFAWACAIVSLGFFIACVWVDDNAKQLQSNLGFTGVILLVAAILIAAIAG